MASNLTPEAQSLVGKVASNTRWASIPPSERAAQTAAARRAGPGSIEWHERQVDPEGKYPPADRRRMAENHKAAYFYRLALRSAIARRKRGGRDE